LQNNGKRTDENPSVFYERNKSLKKRPCFSASAFLYAFDLQIAKSFVELVNTTAGVDELLLAGEEGVAF